MSDPPPKVFISYSHDSRDHAARVLKLVHTLRSDGVEAVIDRFLTSPPEGWTQWMDAHVREDDFVVMVCTETYYRRIIGKEKPATGLGVRWEGNLIHQHIFKAGTDLSRFVPVLLEGGKPAHIPEAVSGSYYFAETPSGYEGLLRRLFNRPVAERAPFGKRPVLPMLSAQWSSRPLGCLRNVPELPLHFLPRLAELIALKQKLLAKDAGAVGVTGVAVQVGAQGMSGIGKSVLAAAVARDDEVRRAFPAGLFWIVLGQKPDPLARQTDLYWMLTGETGGFADVQQGRAQLRGVLHGCECLIILDDVWRLADVEAFNVVDAPGRLLLTTRDGSVLKSIGATEHRVGRLCRNASLALLAQSSGVAFGGLPAAAEAIAAECGDLPLALALVGGMVGGQAEMWDLVLGALRQADLDQIEGKFPSYPYPHVFAALEASVNALDGDGERYFDFAIFPEGVSIPEPLLKALWVAAGMNPLQVRNLITCFRDRSLISLDPQGRFSLHDLQFDFVRKRVDDPAALHGRLLNTYAIQCSDGWSTGPDDGYFFQHLSHHLVGAGRADEWVALLHDYRWIAAKLKHTDIVAVLSDYQQAAEDPALHRIAQALRLSAHVLARRPGVLASQLLGRLAPADAVTIASLLDEARRYVDRPALLPVWPTLARAGGTPLIQLLAGHKGVITAVAVLPHGRRALSGSGDRTLRLWDLETGAELRPPLIGHEDRIRAMAVLPHGRRALSGSDDRTLRLWDLETGAELRPPLIGHKGMVTAVAVLANGRRALSGSGDRTLRLWDLETGAELRSPLAGHQGWVRAVAVLANGRRALSGSDDGTLRLWDLETGAELRPPLAGHQDRITSVAVLPDGRRALSGSGDRTLRLWDLESGAELRPPLAGHQDRITSVAVLADGRRALSGSDDGTLRLWDLETGAELAVFTADSGILCVALTPDGKGCVAGDARGQVHVLKILDGTVPSEQRLGSSTVVRRSR